MFVHGLLNDHTSFNAAHYENLSRLPSQKHKTYSMNLQVVAVIQG